jgi:hypothetical protein
MVSFNGSALGRTDILNGWKEISTYLRMGVRTVQRYEEFGLPIRRPAGKQRGSVIATKGELDTWVTARPVRGVTEPHVDRIGRSPAWTDFKAGMAEMRRLRVEMRRLRAETVASLDSLHSRLHFMHNANEKPQQDPGPWQETEPGAKLLFDTSQPKAD